MNINLMKCVFPTSAASFNLLHELVRCHSLLSPYLWFI